MCSARPSVSRSRPAAATRRRRQRPKSTSRCLIISVLHAASSGNAHGYDNSIVLDALARHGGRLRGVAITDARIAPDTLRDWHRLGMRGLRFHVFSTAGRPGYVRGVGLDVFESFRPVMRELGWVMQVWCDWRALPDVADKLSEISAEMPVVVDHMLSLPAGRGTTEPAFQTLLRLVGEGRVHAKLAGSIHDR